MSTVVQIIVIVALLEIVAELFLKKWSKGEVEINLFLLLGILVYMIVAVLYAFSLRYGMLSIVSALWQGLTLIFTFLLAVLYFNELPSIKPV